MLAVPYEGYKNTPAMKHPDEKIIPMRIPVVLGKQLHQDIDDIAKLTHYSSQDIMRLALRIGLTDLLSVGNDLPKLVKQSADELGLSFADFAKAKASLSNNLAQQALDEIEQVPCADTVPSTGSSPAHSPTKQKDANIVQLPPPPVLATLLHDALKAAEKTTSPPVTEQRQEVTYQKPSRKKK